jgi:hypothetical protein
MTAPVPPGRVQAPPLTAGEAERVARFDAAPDLDLAAEARVKTVAHGMLPGSHEQPGGPECRCGAAWDAEQAGCGHPNHGSPDHDCTPFLAALAPADHEPAAAIQRAKIEALSEAREYAREATRIGFAEKRGGEFTRHWAGVSGWLKHRIATIEAGGEPNWPDAAVFGVQPAATEPGQ